MHSKTLPRRRHSDDLKAQVIDDFRLKPLRAPADEDLHDQGMSLRKCTQT